MNIQVAIINADSIAEIKLITGFRALIVTWRHNWTLKYIGSRDSRGIVAYDIGRLDMTECKYVVSVLRMFMVLETWWLCHIESAR